MSDFRIRSYAGPKHPIANCGDFLLETINRGSASASTELHTYLRRMERGEIERVEIIAMEPRR